MRVTGTCVAKIDSSICKACGSTVIDISNNTGLQEFSSDDWIVYCSNKGCGNHKGTGVFQDWPDWCVSK